jgi:peptidoglycan/xylan/chitin deacetylase (PgdA/CDA1 family)
MIISIVMVAGIALLAGTYVVSHPIPVVLMFHSIVEQPNGLDVSPQQLKTFLDSARASDRPLLFTTDSSDRSIYDEFSFRVREHGFSAILFLMPSMIGRNGMLTWDQVRELDRAGVVIASHTLTHPWLPDLSDALASYWVTAREALLAFVPIDVPRTPNDWSYEQWRKTVRPGELCRKIKAMGAEGH